MKEIAKVLETAKAPKEVKIKDQKVFLQKRSELWERIQAGEFPSTYISVGNKKFTGAQAKTAIRCDFLMASKIALGAKFRKDLISDLAQRDLLFYILRYREKYPDSAGEKFYCCPRCTEKVRECVEAKVFRYIDNAKWKEKIEPVAGGDATR